MTTVEQERSVRASGLTADEEVIQEIQKTADDPVEPELPEERSRSFKFPGFSRMRTEWYGDDGNVMRMVHHQVQKVIDAAFEDLLAIRFELYLVVRQPEMQEDGVSPKVDEFGWPIWAHSSTGNYIEDWSRLTNQQRERFLFQITTRLFEWEQTRDEMWAEAMMSKTQWEEAFSEGWEKAEKGKRTEGDRTAAGRLASAQERYFAIYKTYLSRRAESLVQGMERLSQRIKDVHTA